MSLPQAAVTLIGHCENVRRQLPHLVFAVQLNCSAVIKACYLLVGIYCCQDRTNVCLSRTKQRKTIMWEKCFNNLVSTVSFHMTSTKQSVSSFLLLTHYLESVQILNYSVWPNSIMEAGSILGFIASVLVMRFGKKWPQSVFVGHHSTMKRFVRRHAKRTLGDNIKG